MKLLGGEFVAVHALAMVWDITKIVIIPVVAGLAFHYLIRGRFGWLDKAMPIASMTGIALIITVITAAGRDSLLKVGSLADIGHVYTQCGWFYAGLLVLPPPEICPKAIYTYHFTGSGHAERRPCFPLAGHIDCR